MNTLADDFMDGMEHGREPGPPRAQVQVYARAITESVPNPYAEQMEKQGGLAYPYPGKNPSGEM